MMQLKINDLKVSIDTPKGKLHALRGIDIEIKQGEIVGLLGESGAGKSITMKSIAGLLPSGAIVENGEITFNEHDLLELDEKHLDLIRASEIACIMQNPTTAINPIVTIGKQMCDVLKTKQKASIKKAKTNIKQFEKKHHIKLLKMPLVKSYETIENLQISNNQKNYIKNQLNEVYKKTTPLDYKNKCIELLDTVGIDNPQQRFHQYPFELSGGMCQRVAIAMALSGNPKLVLCDEVTTALDVTTQAKILELLLNLQKKNHFSMLFISHNLAVLKKMCQRIYVMYAGRIVEEGTTDEIYYHSKHPYTKALFDSLPSLNHLKKLKPIIGKTCDLIDVKDMDQFAPRNPYAMEIDYQKEPPLFSISETHKVRSWLMHPYAKELEFNDNNNNEEMIRRIFKPSDKVVLNVSNISKKFYTRFGNTQALKNVSLTLRESEILAIVGESGSGKTTLGKTITKIHKADSGEINLFGNQVQMIFQDANAAMNPRMTVFEIISEGLYLKKKYSKEEIYDAVSVCMDEVGLSKDVMYRYPFELSGGQKQRVEIARAIIVNPACIIADEPVSDLDASIQAGIINLFEQIKNERGISIIFITHDISLVKYLADSLCVMYKGEIVEMNSKTAIFQNPKHEYTKTLFASCLKID